MNKQINDDGEKNITDKMIALFFSFFFFFVFLGAEKEKKKKRRNKGFIFKLLFRRP